ncbi:MAG: proline--tRNA ligase [Bacilli bacterium]|nr:proline--tRNA ligase [Bacilli bacterium]
MKQSRFLIPTSKVEIGDDVTCKSLSFMLKAGMIKQIAAGVYSYLPLAWNIIKKIEDIVRLEMNKAESYELNMPIMQPKELWDESGRWEKYGKELMRMKDRKDRDFCLQPTSEEVITTIVRDNVKSWRLLPLNLFQIQTKFRDEARPRFGLMRGREFIMKDSYSFDLNEEGLDYQYHLMEKAYENIFNKCGLKTIKVNADNGAIGGSESIEFMAVSEIGEDTLVYCDKCGYQANLEKATANYDFAIVNEDIKDIELIDTPNIMSIDDIASFLSFETNRTAKYITFKDDTNNKYYLVVIQGNYDINETKLLNLVKAQELRMLSDDEIIEQNLVKGFIGAINFNPKDKFIIVLDEALLKLKNFTAGANVKDKHYINVNYERDFKADFIGDVKEVHTNDKCVVCNETLSFDKGIEVGQIFKLGTVYSEALGCTYLDKNQKAQPMWMGCYGIGISRILMAVVEAYVNEDNNSIIYPKLLQPFDVHLIMVDGKKEKQLSLANEISDLLVDNNINVLFDDRHERVGSKFADSDLIGVNIRIIVGKKADENVVELVNRLDSTKIEINKDELLKTIKGMI